VTFPNNVLPDRGRFLSFFSAPLPCVWGQAYSNDFFAKKTKSLPVHELPPAQS